MDSPTVVEGEALALHPPFITQTPLPKITCRARPPEKAHAADACSRQKFTRIMHQ